MSLIPSQDLLEKKHEDEDFKGWLGGWYKGLTQLKDALEELDDTRDMLKSCSAASGKLFPK